MIAGAFTGPIRRGEDPVDLSDGLRVVPQRDFSQGRIAVKHVPIGRAASQDGALDTVAVQDESTQASPIVGVEAGMCVAQHQHGEEVVAKVSEQRDLQVRPDGRLHDGIFDKSCLVEAIAMPRQRQ